MNRPLSGCVKGNMWASRGGVLWEETLALAYARCWENISEGGGKAGGSNSLLPLATSLSSSAAALSVFFYFYSSLKDSPG